MIHQILFKAVKHFFPNRLSERNVIELVTKLIELHLVDVLYTSDGKTYVTHQQLVKEIKDELIVHGGREEF